MGHVTGSLGEAFSNASVRAIEREKGDTARDSRRRISWRKEIGQVKVTSQGLGARLGARAPRGLGPRPPERLVSVALKSLFLGGRCRGGGGLEGSGHGIPPLPRPLPQGRKEEKPSNTYGPKKYPSYEDLQQGTPSFEKGLYVPIEVRCMC